MVFASSFLSHSEHSDAQLWYIGCSATAFIGQRQTDSWTPFFKSVKFSFASSCAKFVFKFLGGHMFEGSAQTLFDIWLRQNSLKISTIFFIT